MRRHPRYVNVGYRTILLHNTAQAIFINAKSFIIIMLQDIFINRRYDSLINVRHGKTITLREDTLISREAIYPSRH
jgi:hypothetical protein